MKTQTKFRPVAHLNMKLQKLADQDIHCHAIHAMEHDLVDDLM